MNDLAQAMALHRAGKLAEAEAIYRGLLGQRPEDGQLHNLLGLVACQTGRLEEAAELLTRAVAREGANAEYLINLGEIQRRRGRMAEALAAFGRAAELAPQNVFAHYNLAVALAASGRAAEAIGAYRRALALQPNFAEALNNLGLLLGGAGQNEEAAECLRRALALRPNHAEAENNLGLILWNLDRHEEALAAFDHALQAKPESAAVHANRGRTLRRLGHRHEALEALQTAARLAPAAPDIVRDLAKAYSDVGRHADAIAAARLAIALSPQQAEAHQVLGVVLSAAGDPALRGDAIAALRRALELRPAPEWEFELANLEGRTPATAPDAYVQKLFDDYAANFERHLVEELRYRVPQDLLAALRAAWSRLGAPAQDLDILDLGCGTGLCGEVFRPHARSIVGIDLAPKMAAAARARRDGAGRPFYDRVIRGHLLPAVREFDACFDLILAADVFIYVGALDDLFPAAARALRPGGLFAFSLERHDSADGKDFVLHHRFQHSLAYIRRLAEQNTLTEVTAQECPIRGDVAPGWLVILRK